MRFANKIEIDNPPHLRGDSLNNDFVVASYNIHKCVGIDKIFNPARIINVISELNADIIALQEVDKRFGKQIGLLDLDDLKKKSGSVPIPLKNFSPNFYSWHGNALFFRKGTVRHIQQIPLPGMEPRGALIAILDLKQGPVRIVATHFGLLRHSRLQQTAKILSLLQTNMNIATILIGDFNEWRIGKKSSLTAFSQFFDITEVKPSFPSRFPFLALDRIFAYPNELISSINIHESPLSREASDHLPIKAHIDLSML